LVSAKLGKWELYNLHEDRTELSDLADREPERVAAMRADWFRMAANVDRLEGRALAPVRDRITPLSFRRDTSSGAAPSRVKKQ
jgi:arylsulfatase